MGRGLIKRRAATAVLVLFIGLCLAASASLVLGPSVDDVVRRASRVLNFPSGSVSVGDPIRLSSVPDVVVTRGTVVPRTSAAGIDTVVLNEPVFEVTLPGDDDQPTARAATAHLLQPLFDRIYALDLSKATVKRGTMIFRWGRGHSLSIDDIDAEITTRSNTIASVVGSFTYRGQKVEIDIKSWPAQATAALEVVAAALSDRTRLATGPATASAMRRPFKVDLKAAALAVRLDGDLEIGAAWRLSGKGEFRSTDAASLAAWLGFDPSHSSGGPALQVVGPVTWSKGTITFGKSQISLNAQDGVGALSLTMHDERPLIEATAAFPALDVAPLLYRAQSRGAGGTASATWRTLATSFPSIAHIDSDLRVSAARLQWQGEPVGRGAVTVSSRGGKLHADFAELDLGASRGNLQIMIDETVASPQTSLRGRFSLADISPVAAQIFGAGAAKGKFITQFEVAGRGQTLGAVIDAAVGRGTIEASEGGQIALDLPALQALGQKAAGASVGTGGVVVPNVSTGWGSAATFTSFEALNARFQLRGGDVIVEQSAVWSKGLVANILGRIGIAASDLDLKVGLAASQTSGGPARQGAPAKPLPATARAVAAESGTVIAIRGPWTQPVISAEQPGSQP